MTEQQSNQSAQITFRGDPIPVLFEDILAYQLGSGFFAVQTKEGKMYIYPSDRIEQIIYSQE
jgi:hypothetical protein